VSLADAGGACVRRRILVVADGRRTVKTLRDVLHAHGWEAIAQEPFIAEIDSDPHQQAAHGDHPDR
jgi:hypothetical protein